MTCYSVAIFADGYFRPIRQSSPQNMDIRITKLIATTVFHTQNNLVA